MKRIEAASVITRKEELHAVQPPSHNLQETRSDLESLAILRDVSTSWYVDMGTHVRDMGAHQRNAQTASLLSSCSWVVPVRLQSKPGSWVQGVNIFSCIKS